jgi:hypothetical protein
MNWSNIISEDSLVQSPENKASIREWTDYCELLTLTAEDKMLDSDQLCSRILKSMDFKAVDEDKLDKKERREKEWVTSRISDVYAHVKLRLSLLPDKYPFAINDDDQLCLTADEVTREQVLYLILLCASNLKYTNRKNNPLTSDFEVVSLLYMRKLFPSMSFRLFGSRNTNKHLSKDDSISGVKLKERIVNMADFIFIGYHNDEINDIDEQDHGDKGIDIVGMRPMDDGRKSVPVMFGQCACSREKWKEKQFSTSNSIWDKYIKTHITSIQRFIFVADWLINSDKNLANEVDITDNVLIDRQRLMMLADDSFLEKCGTLDIL